MYYLNSQLLYMIPVAAVVSLLLVAFSYWHNSKVANGYGEWKLLANSSKPLSGRLYLVYALLAVLASSSLMLALARPVLPDGTVSIAKGKVDVVAVVDVSRSMAAMDYEGKVPLSMVATSPMEHDGSIGGDAAALEKEQIRGQEVAGTRLEMVRYLIQENMLKVLDGNQFGIVSYAGQAFPQSYLTRDTSTLAWVVDRGLTVSSAPGEGSGMGKALNLAINMFDADSKEGREKVLILFSDGGNDDNPRLIQEFAKKASARNIQVVVLGFGNNLPSKIPVSKLAFDDDYARSLLHHGKQWYEVDGQIEKTKMDGRLLQNIASMIGGTYIHVQEFDDLDLSEHVGKEVMENVEGSKELFQWAILIALISSILMIAVRHELRKRGQS